MSPVTIHAAKTNLSTLIAAALRGEEVVIAKGGKPVVRLVPLARDGFKTGLRAGRLGAGPDFPGAMDENGLEPWEGRR